MPINCYIKSDWQEVIIEKILPGVFIGRLVSANNKFQGREAKGLSKGRYDETFAGEDAPTTAFDGAIDTLPIQCRHIEHLCLWWVYCFHVVRPSVRASVRNALFP